MRKSCNICRGRAPGRGAGRPAKAPPLGGKPGSAGPSGSSLRPGPDWGKEGGGCAEFDGTALEWPGRTFLDHGVLASPSASPGREAHNFLCQAGHSTAGETEALRWPGTRLNHEQVGGFFPLGANSGWLSGSRDSNGE